MKQHLIASVVMAIACSSAQTAEAPTTKVGAFTVTTNSDAMSDKVIVRATTVSSDSDRSATLEWRCEGGTALVIYRFNVNFLGVGYKGSWVRYRVDQTAATDYETWQLHSGSRNRAVYLLGDEDPEKIKAFTDAALPGTKILIEALDLDNKRTVRDTFSLSGLSNALKKLDCMKAGGVAAAP